MSLRITVLISGTIRNQEASRSGTRVGMFSLDTTVAGGRFLQGVPYVNGDVQGGN